MPRELKIFAYIAGAIALGRLLTVLLDSIAASVERRALYR